VTIAAPFVCVLPRCGFEAVNRLRREHCLPLNFVGAFISVTVAGLVGAAPEEGGRHRRRGRDRDAEGGRGRRVVR